MVLAIIPDAEFINIGKIYLLGRYGDSWSVCGGAEFGYPLSRLIPLPLCSSTKRFCYSGEYAVYEEDKAWADAFSFLQLQIFHVLCED